MAQHEAEDVEMKGAAGRLSQARGISRKALRQGRAAFTIFSKHSRSIPFHSIALHPFLHDLAFIAYAVGRHVRVAQGLRPHSLQFFCID
jgi:hypothetical protein